VKLHDPRHPRHSVSTIRHKVIVTLPLEALHYTQGQLYVTYLERGLDMQIQWVMKGRNFKIII